MRAICTASAWACLGAIALVAAPAHAWDTPEHITFGNRIAQPFERMRGGALPVLAATNGPHTFGHWVSAPDFGRGITHFLNEEPVFGNLACAVLWSAKGEIDGKPIDDQVGADGSITSTDPTIKRALADCADGWRTNNSHFGDFAAQHFLKYHRLAIEAAALYRRTRSAACQKAAYTVEGWAQHYLTDSTAAGHAWNPPGTYDHTFGLQTWTGPGVRMRIHNFLNGQGVRMAGAQYDRGTFWGDGSKAHTDDGRMVPERDDAQSQMAVRLARLALGQVVTTECGARPNAGDVFATRDEANDPRRLYVSNHSMCQAFWGHEFEWWSNSIDTWGLTEAALKQLVVDCKAGGGDLQVNANGSELATDYMSDKYAPEHGAVQSLATDGKSDFTLEELGCEDGGLMPLSDANARDVCGNVMCDVPADARGACPAGFGAGAGCCYRAAMVSESGAAEALPFARAEGGGRVDLSAAGAVPGDATEFLWFDDDGRPAAHDDDSWQPLDTPLAATLAGAGTVTECRKVGDFAVWEARVRLPRAAALKGKVLALHVDGMDEGLKVQVNGRLVAYLSRDTDNRFQPLSVPLATPSAPRNAAGDYAVRLVHLNDCGDARPLMVSLAIDEKADGIDDGDLADDAACQLARGRAGRGPFAFVLLLGLPLLLLRRRRAAAR